MLRCDLVKTRGIVYRRVTSDLHTSHNEKNDDASMRKTNITLGSHWHLNFGATDAMLVTLTQ
ncbi:hypothetical protein ACTXT7_009565 [Hymenolepis weldensis]